MTKLKLPIAGEILELVLDYLYTDIPLRIIGEYNASDVQSNLTDDAFNIRYVFAVTLASVLENQYCAHIFLGFNAIFFFQSSKLCYPFEKTYKSARVPGRYK